MMSYKEIISQFIEVAAGPGKHAKQARAAGKTVVGCFPVYTPAELIYAAGMFPIGLWGRQVESNEAKAYIPAFTCSIMQSCLELGLTGAYDDLSAVIIPSMCDTFKCIAQDFKVGVPKVRLIQFAHPQMRKIEMGVAYLKGEYQRIREALEQVAGKKITEDAIAEAIDIFNAYRQALRRFTGLAQEHVDIVTPLVRHAVIKAGYFMDKPVYTSLLHELCDGLTTLSISRGSKRVLLTGILAEPNTLLEKLSENGLAVAADDLAQETRQFRYDVPTDSGDPMYNLAKWWQVFEGCSMAFDPEKKRIDMIIDDVKKHGINGVIVCMMKFCDPEEYDYPLLKKALEENGIPELFMEIDQQSEIDAQAGTRIQAFSEIL